MKPQRQWVTVDYVCEATGFSKYHVYELARKGLIPSIRTLETRTVRFDPDAIDRWMQAKAKAS